VILEKLALWTRIAIVFVNSVDREGVQFGNDYLDSGDGCAAQLLWARRIEEFAPGLKSLRTLSRSAQDSRGIRAG